MHRIFSHKKSNGISGKLISVLWDDWKKFHKSKKELKNSDVGTLRRIVGRDRKKIFLIKMTHKIETKIKFGFIGLD